MTDELEKKMRRRSEMGTLDDMLAMLEKSDGSGKRTALGDVKVGSFILICLNVGNPPTRSVHTARVVEKDDARITAQIEFAGIRTSFSYLTPCIDLGEILERNSDDEFWEEPGMIDPDYGGPDYKG
jgi:hypothetical protein